MIAVDNQSAVTPDAGAGERWLRSRLPSHLVASLAKQGFIAFNRLASGARCAKLRFRDANGRQRVLYLGVSPTLVANVEAAVRRFRHPRASRQRIRAITRQCRRHLSHTKRRLTTTLAGTGWHFHGHELRHARLTATLDDNLDSRCRSSSMPSPDADQQTSPESTTPSDNSKPSSPKDLAQGLMYAVNSTMQLGSLLRQPAIDHLRGAESPLEACKEIKSLLDMLLRFDRQIDRYTNVIMRLQEAEAKKEPTDTYSVQRAAAHQQWAEAQRRWELEMNASRSGPSHGDGRPPR